MYAQTIDEFLFSPMGKDFNVVPAKSRELMVEELRQRLKRLEKEKGKIVPKVYKDGDHRFFHVVIPSERLEAEVTYDVVIELYPTDVSGKDLLKYHFNMFSNSPSFTFTNANMIYYYGLGVILLSDKYNKIVMEEEAVIKNPSEIMLYEKSITWSLLIIKEFLERNDNFPIADTAKQLVRIIRTDETIRTNAIKDRARIKSEKEKEETWTHKYKKEQLQASKINKVSRNPSLVSNPKKTPRVKTSNRVGKSSTASTARMVTKAKKARRR